MPRINRRRIFHRVAREGELNALELGAQFGDGRIVDFIGAGPLLDHRPKRGRDAGGKSLEHVGRNHRHQLFCGIEGLGTGDFRAGLQACPA